MEEITRRRTILGAMGVGAAALAGCVSGDDSNGEDGQSGDSGDQDSVIVDKSLTHLESGCGGPDAESVAVAAEDGIYLIDGVFSTSNPCHHAELGNVSFDDDTITVVVESVRETDEDDQPVVCPDCVGEVVYEATVELESGETAESVEVVHEDGETHERSAGEFDTNRPTIEDAAIATVRAEPRGNESEWTEINIGDDAVTVNGTVHTSHPRYEALIDAVGIRHRQLQLAVEVEATDADDEAGATVNGEIEYEATIDVPGAAALESIRVDHPETTHGYGWDSNSESASVGDSDDSGSVDDREE